MSDLKSVNEAADALRRVRAAREQVSDFICGQINAGGASVPGLLDNGYQCLLVKHRDGSGQKIDMMGCFVGIEVAEAVYGVLAEKEKAIVEWLANMGVTP